MKKKTILILLAGLFCISPQGFAQPAASDRNVIMTDGTAEATGRNDSARLSIAVVTEAKSLDVAGTENDAKTRAVLKAVKGLGIENLKLRTTGYRVTPQRDYKARPPVIRGYEIFNAIEATLEGWEPEQLSQQVAKILAKALGNGANNIQTVQFYIKNRASLENEALKQAVAQAVMKAKTMAAAAGVKLKSVASLSTYPAQMPPQPRTLRAMEMKSEAADAAPPIEIGESRISVQVSIVYEIEP